MDVGFYFNLDSPPHWGQDQARLYGFYLELCEEIDRLGGHSVWFSEHHLFPGGHLTQPLTFAAAVAARTRNVRIGTGVTIASLRHPVHLAEEATIVDLLSAGRLDLGLGAGYRQPEYALFGADLSARYDTTDERVRELRVLWADHSLTPRPVQPRLPVWMGYMGPKGARRAGLLGERLLTAEGAMWEHYRNGLLAGGHGAARAEMAGGVSCWITPDPDADWPIVSTHLAHKWDAYRRLSVEGTDRPVPRPVDPDALRGRPLGGVLRAFMIDTPEGAASRIRSELTRGAPVTALHIDSPLAGMPEDLIVRHVQTVCRDLAPLLRDIPMSRAADDEPLVVA